MFLPSTRQIVTEEKWIDEVQKDKENLSGCQTNIGVITGLDKSGRNEPIE
jgi:hypothetical protein